MSTNKDTKFVDKGQSHKKEEEEGFVTFKSSLIPFGLNSIEVSVLSEFETLNPDFKSKA